MDNDKAIGILNDLIEICRDGEYGFKEAAQNVKSSDLKSLFTSIEEDRGRYVAELQHQVRGLGGDPANSGSTAGALHRVWIDIKGTLAGKDEKSILSECERGEDSAVKAYEEALRENLPASCRPVLDKQYREIKVVHDRIKQMRDARSATAGKRYE
jgi:uncharacterized protein (TIGR02284 family)